MVFTPSPLLTVTIEARPDEVPEIHLHAGGQGVWIARMVSELGGDVRLCGPFGGESGDVLRTLVEREGLDLRAVATAASNGGYVHDRRRGEREVVATTPPPPLRRHEHDQLYDLALLEGLDSRVAVLGGPDGEHVLSPETYRRLAQDLTSQCVAVVADLSGAYLDAVVEGGVHVLKVSHEELIEDGRATGDDPSALLKAASELVAAGAANVVVSRADQPALALIGDRPVLVEAPLFERADHRGAGDSMTAGLTVGVATGDGLESALRLGAAAGALNVTRHGLASGHRDLIERLAERVVLRELD